MVYVYVTLLYAGKRTWEQIPENLKENVKVVLKEEVSNGVITPERYKEITGDSYDS